MIESSVSSLFFWVFALISILGAIAVISTKKILRSAIYLIGVLFCTAIYYVLLGMDFLAGVQVLVYVGGIVVLIIFAVMLTSGVEMTETSPTWTRKLVAAFCSLGFLVPTLYVIQNMQFHMTDSQNKIADVKQIGIQLLSLDKTGYVIPFEVISLLLISVFVGSLVIAKKERNNG